MFGLGGGAQDGGAGGKERMERIGDYAVYATPMKEGAQWRLAGRIESEGAEGKRVRRFIRADLFSSQDDAVDITFRKAKQIIEQHGPSLFSDDAADRTV